MKRFFLITIIALTCSTLMFAQKSTEKISVKYAQAELQGKKMSGAPYDNYMMYASGRYQIFINKETQKIAVKSMGKEVLNWEAKESNEYTSFEPHFFVPDFKNFPILVMVEEIIDGSSNGQHIVLMNKGQAHYCGFINLAADKGEGSSVSKYANINMDAGNIIISFNSDSNLFSWESYEVYKGKDVGFQIDLKDIKSGLKPTSYSKYKEVGGSGSYPEPEEKLDNNTGKQPGKEDFEW